MSPTAEPHKHPASSFEDTPMNKPLPLSFAAVTLAVSLAAPAWAARSAIPRTASHLSLMIILSGNFPHFL
jgi:hypothetical protein